MAALLLDTAAVATLAAGRKDVHRRRVRALMAEAVNRDANVIVPSPVLAELYRGDENDVWIDRILDGNGIRVAVMGERIGRLAGELRQRNRLDARGLLDCMVVATAIGLGGAVIATGDSARLAALCRSHRNVVPVQV